MGPGRVIRRADWEGRLGAMIAIWRVRNLAWDRNCALFAADCVVAVTGADPIADIRHKLASARAFAGALRAADGTLAGAVSARLGPAAAAGQARRGDIVGRDYRGLALGVCCGSASLFLGDVGLVAFPARDVTHCWRVG